ncbi:copper-binding protein [Variovorax arabinosiphilus]|uniref:copper-binding protein n=1 Tax=Variovorax arabinosiphilus TaxID=3053498 RepID=UPI002577B154|nr:MULTISPECIES: copper-binding protein [unclassified Variovorax]MDM0119416.1 copper-binding protein [Variovorax sp. J2L1-78]MDM0129842.1 copper-binding protein [Variovorax sp. J2L1-63]MDM0232372.1 copper-binding protein [Variovorax sp. J2R1-6]
MSNIHRIRLAVAAAFLLSGAAIAQSSTSMADTPGINKTAPMAPGADAAAASEFSEGEIRKVDKDNKKLTIKHGPLKNLDMPGMTMVFGVDDDAVLEKLEAGARVRFQAEKVDGKIIATRIEVLR